MCDIDAPYQSGATLEVSEPGRRFYGVDIGIMALDTRTPRVVGDVGNAQTFPFPVLYRTVAGADPLQVVERDPRDVLPLFISAARELVDSGVVGIATTCGFLAAVQAELTAECPVPVLTSSLLQIPMVLRGLAPDRKVCVLTANAQTLGSRHFDGVGISIGDRERLTVAGVEDVDDLYPHLMDRSPGPLSVERVSVAVVEKCRDVVESDPGIAAFVFECVNLPPYAHAVKQATGLPVWDATTMIVNLWRAVRRG